jgi:hypothetical protein
MRARLVPKLSTAHPLVDKLLVDGEEDPRIASRGELTEHSTVDAPLCLGDEVKEVMREEIVIAWCRIGDHVRPTLPLDENAVVSGTRLQEVNDHQLTSRHWNRRSDTNTGPL